MLVAVSLLAISLSVLLYRVPPSTWSLFQRLAARPASGSSATDMPPADAADQLPPTEKEHDDEHAPQKGLLGTGTQSSPQTTPKAAPDTAQNGASIPTFTLAEHDASSDEDEDLPPPSFPAMNSAQRASQPSAPRQPQQPTSMAPPPSKPTLMAPPPKPAGPSLMPPPQMVASNLRPLPSASPAALRVPTTGPLPNRGPAPNRSPGGLAPQPSTVKTPNARGKVLLSPGHSPLDWANLQRSGENLAGVPALTRVTPAMLKYNNGRKGKPAWSAYQGKVYNMTPYLPFHPGGEGELRRAAGKDGGKLFMEVHPWVNWENMLGECLVGIMVSEEPTASLEDMD